MTVIAFLAFATVKRPPGTRTPAVCGTAERARRVAARWNAFVSVGPEMLRCDTCTVRLERERGGNDREYTHWPASCTFTIRF